MKTKKLRFVVQKAQKLLGAPTRGCKRLRIKRRGGQKVSAEKLKSARFDLPWCSEVKEKVGFAAARGWVGGYGFLGALDCISYSVDDTAGSILLTERR